MRWVDVLFLRTWWRYSQGISPPVSAPYHFFNLIEGTVWVVLGLLVFYRYLRAGRSAIEIGYALAFFSFGLTDFREAYVLESWLIWAKLVNLVALFELRALVIRRYYPVRKLY